MQVETTPAYNFVGEHTDGVTPVPIPNTEVKRASADGTGRATAWESRSVRGIFPFAGVAQSVEHDLAKVGVAGSSPVSRSNTQTPQDKNLGGFALPPGGIKMGSKGG